MRKSCYDCVKKHLGSAGVFIKETKMGYPDYEIWVIGELEHAADECLEVNPELAAVIREHRLAWTHDRNHIIPFEAFNRYINCCVLADNSNVDGMTIAIPDELTDGMMKTEDGKLVISGDTRP